MKNHDRSSEKWILVEKKKKSKQIEVKVLNK